MKRCLRVLFKKEGGKKIINVERIVPLMGLLVGITLLSYCTYIVFWYQEDKNFEQIKKTSTPLFEESFKEPKSLQDAKFKKGKKEGDFLEKNKSHKIKRRYHARQVLTPKENSVKKEFFPSVGNLLAELLTGIDTRSSEGVKAMLSVDSAIEDHTLPAGTTFFGKVWYRGAGDRVFIQFEKGFYPDGQEFSVRAQALSVKDYLPGLRGKVHKNTKGRLLTTMGLSLISGVSRALIEREALGQGFHIAPKPSVKNGLYEGISRVTKDEAQQKASGLYNKSKYLTVEAGRDMVIALTELK